MSQQSIHTDQRTETPQIYKTSWFVRFTAIILFPVVLIFFCFLPAGQALASIDRVGYPLAMLISLVCMALAAYSIYYFLLAFKARIEITWPDKLTIIYPFQTIELRTDEVKGYYVFIYQGGDTLFVLVPKDHNRKPVNVRLIYQRSQDLGDWIKRKFVDLEEDIFNNERRAFFADTAYGLTLKQLESYYNDIKSRATILNALGCATFALFAISFYGDLASIKGLAITLNLVCPWIIIVAVFYLKGMVKLGNNSIKSFYPSVITGYLLPCAAVLISCSNYHVILYQNLFYPFAGISLLLWLATRLIVKNSKLFCSSMAYITVACIAYGYGATLYINCRLDVLHNEVVKTEIIDRHPEKGKSSNYFVVSPWGPFAENQEVTVSSKLYQQHINDQKLALVVHQGRLHIPWFEVM
jgi:hypothetical protein